MKAIIFDCDGVLIDSEVLACGVEVDLLAAAGVPITLDVYLARYVGKPIADLLTELGGRLPADFEARASASVAAAFERDLRALPGAATTLAALSARRVPIAVASNSAPARLAHSLGLTGLAGYFGPHVYSATMVPRGKPAPDVYLLAAERLGVRPTECLVLEDSPHGVTAAVAAGMAAYGLDAASHTGPGHAERLRAAGARDVFSAFADVARYL